MEGVYATLALVGAVTGYGFTKAKKQSFQKYVMSSQEIETTKQAGQELDAIAQASPNKSSAYDYLLRKLPEFVRTKATKTLESLNQSKRSGAPPSVAYSNLRLALLTDRELGNITANQELFFPKREVFYKWFREGLAAPPLPPGPVTPESARRPRSGSEFTDRSASQFTDRSRSDSVPPSLMDLETKRMILRRMGITDRITFGQWAEQRRQTNPERVAEVEAYVNEVFPVVTVPVPQPREEGWGGEATPTLWTPTPQPQPAPAPTVTVPTPAPAPIRIPSPPPTPQPQPAPAPTVTVPPPEPGAGLGFGTQPETPVPTPVETPGPLPITTAPAPAPTVTVPTPAPTVTVPTPAPTVTVPTPAPAAALEFTQVNPMFAPAPEPPTTIPSPRGPQSMASRWRTQRARRNLFGRQPPPAPTPEFTQVNPMVEPAPAPPQIPQPTREPMNEQARAALFGRQPPAAAVTQRQRPSLLSRLRRVTLRAPRGATKKQKDAKAALDQLAITNVDEFSAYLQGKSSTEQMDALQNGVIAYPDDADLFLDAMTADETAGTAFAQSSDALKKPIQKAADKARKKRPAALVTEAAAISAMTTAPPAPEEGTTPEAIASLTAAPPAPVPQPPPTKVSEIRPATAVGPSYAPVGIPPHMRGIVTPLPSAFVRETPAPAVTVPTPAPSVPVPTPAPTPPNKEELLTYLREQTPPIVDMNSFLAWVKANQTTLSQDEILRVYKMAIAAFPASAAPLTSAPRIQAVPLPIPAATPQQIEELRGFLAMQTPPITDLASLQQWMRANVSKSEQEKENIFLVYERVFQTSVNRDFILGPATPTPAPLTVPAPPPSQPRTPEEMEAQLNEIAAAGTGLGIVAPPPLPVSRLTRQQGTRQITPRRARTRAEARKEGLTRLRQAGIPINQQGLTPEEEAVLRQADEAIAEARGRLPQQQPSPEMQELEDVLNAPTPTPASQASAATASSGEVWTPETATVPATVPAPPPGPPPATVPVPPGNLSSQQAKEWLATNLGVQNQQDFRRWMRENTSIVTDPILTTAEVAFPMGTLAGATNFRTVYEALKSGKTARATTQRRGGRKVRKNTLRRRPRVNTKHVRRTSHRKNRAKRTD